MTEKWDHQSWEEIYFGIVDPFNYQYSLETDGNVFTASAFGDLDCDGVFSTFELSGVIDAETGAKTRFRVVRAAE